MIWHLKQLNVNIIKHGKYLRHGESQDKEAQFMVDQHVISV